MIDMFSDSIFDFSLCPTHFFVAFFAYYVIDQVGAIAGYVVFRCVCYIASLISNAATGAQHLQYLQVFVVANICVFTHMFFLHIPNCVQQMSHFPNSFHPSKMALTLSSQPSYHM